MTDEIEKLEELAMAAKNYVFRSDGWECSVEMAEHLRIDENFVKAASPDVILTLIDRLKKAEAELAAMREQKPALFVESEPQICDKDAAYAINSLCNTVVYHMEKPDTSNPVWPLYAGPIAAPVPATQPSEQQIIQRAGEIFGFKPHEQDEVTKARYLDFYRWAKEE